MKLINGPRERIIKYGIKSLEDYELIAILLKTGSKDNNIIELSKEILLEINSFSQLNDYRYEEFLKFKGVGQAKAMTLCAALELSYRIKKQEKNIKTINTVYDEIVLLKNDFYNLSFERIEIVYLNSSLKVISKQILQDGFSFKAILDIKEVLKRALRINACYIITAHNHPSGNVNPSSEDLFTYDILNKRLNEFEIKVFDNIIFSNCMYYSYNYGGVPKKLDKVGKI